MAVNGLLYSGIPLGGLGTGSVELRQDGYFHEWQIMNNAPWGAGPAVEVPQDGAFFAIHACQDADEGDERCTAVLGLPVDYSGQSSLLGHYLNDPYHMPWLGHARAIRSEARFPFTRLSYDLDLEYFPITVELEAFSPFIPLDAASSGLPLAFFTFSLKNESQSAYQVSLLGALRNLAGYAARERPSSMRLGQSNGCSWIELRREALAPDASDNGSLVLGMLGDNPETSYLFHPRSARDLWDPFHHTGRLENVDFGDFKGTIGNMGAERRAQVRRGLPLGALCTTFDLAAGQSRTVTFALAWHFPNFVEAEYAEKQRSAQVIGVHYAAAFQSAVEVLAHGVQAYASLYQRTHQFFDTFYRSSFPGWLLEAVSAQCTTLIKSSWWDRQGRFGIWEGLGCCGLQTTDITYYGSFPIVLFFPEIQFSQMRLTRANIEVPGKIPHMMPANFSCADADHRGRIDLIPQYILLVWRDVLWSGDLDYAREMWPSVKEALAFFQRFDRDGDGLPNNTGPDQTYDQFPLKGTSAFVGFLYAASLEAAAQLAESLGEDSTAEALHQRLKDALHKLDSQLWTGKYYRLCYDPLDGEANQGVMADQVNGDWFIRQTSGESLLPGRKVRSALRTVLAHCSRPEGYVANCAWPFGGAIEIGRHTSDQANSPWSGVEYALAAHLVLAGLEKDGLRVAKMVWERYERAGLRFNHIECGANYYRALSSWAIYLALTGFAYNALTHSLRLAFRRDETHYVINTPCAWGEVSASEHEQRWQLTLQHGALPLENLTLSSLHAAEVQVTLDGDLLDTRFVAGWRSGQVTFEPGFVLKAGQTLEVRCL